MAKDKLKEVKFPYLKETPEDEDSFIKKIKNLFLGRKFIGTVGGIVDERVGIDCADGDELQQSADTERNTTSQTYTKKKEIICGDKGKLRIKFDIKSNPTATKRQYYDSGDNTSDPVWGSNWHAQTFTPSTAHKITKVSLLILKSGTPGTVTVSIKATDGSGRPTGADLAVGTTDGDTLTGTAEWREITFSSPVDLSADTKYAIVVRALDGSGSNDAIYWKRDSVGASYSGGNSEGSTDGGSSWSAYGGADSDFLFEEWGKVYNISVYGKIYKNGVDVGTEQSVTSGTYTTKSEDISDWKKGDLVQLYIKIDSGTTCLIENFRIYSNRWEVKTD